MQLVAYLFALLLFALDPVAPDAPPAALDAAPALQNPGFECGAGFHDQPGIPGMVPNGWTAKILRAPVKVLSTQLWAKLGGCDPGDMSWEKLEGYDSLILLPGEVLYNQYFDAPPFDVALWQTVNVTPNVDYSLSAWMTSLCGGSSASSSCPPGAYMAKMAALDPTGGQNATASDLRWVEDRRPHTEVYWANLITATTAKTDRMTVFLRLNSPFHHHSNHAFADAVKLVRSPQAGFKQVSARGSSIAVSWDGNLGPDIPNIPASTHKVSFELQAKRGSGPWTPWLKGVAAGSASYVAGGSCSGEAVRFRIRAWAIQPSGQNGSWPFHEFVGVWKESAAVSLAATAPGSAAGTTACSPRAYMPLLSR
jgi:hypothetical protein